MKKHLIYNDESSNKFWNIEVTGKSFTVTFGKVGAKGQSQTKEFDDEEKCKKEAEKLINEKLKKGYTEDEKKPAKKEINDKQSAEVKNKIQELKAAIANGKDVDAKINETEKLIKEKLKKVDVERLSEDSKKSTKEKKESLNVELTNPIENTGDLKGGKLPEIMAYYMLNDKNEQKDFLKIVSKNKGKFNTLLENFESFFGYKPSRELIELSECFPAYQKYFESISDTWMLEGGISYVNDYIKKGTKIEQLINNHGFIFTILTGLEIFGSDPSGDSCFLNTLPHPMDITEVYGYDHEIGELNGDVAFSIADFISDRWETSYDYESDEEIKKSTEKVKKIITSFNKGYKEEIKQRAYYHDPKILFKRVEWILGHTTGEPSFHFSKKMSQAPDFKTWGKEKNLISTIPVLANYWLLAHFFLGNKNACRECIELAKKTPGMVTPALALLIENALNAEGKDGFKLGKIKKDKLIKIIAETQKNASSELLEPEVQKVISKARGEDTIEKLTEAQFTKMIQDGADPFTIINDYPDDVKTHDLALKEISKKDVAFQKFVKDYFWNRERGAHIKWIDHKNEIDTRFSLPVSSAFIAGLRFNSDHKNSNEGLTKTLGVFDDENAFKAYIKAFQILNPSDDRLKYIIENMQESSRPEIKEIFKSAAWRFFEILDLAKENEDALKEKRKKEGMTLDNMFEVENNFLEVLHLVLAWNNDDSLKLAETILDEKYNKNFRIFKRSFGDAIRIAGNHKASKHLYLINWYVEAVGKIKAERKDTFIDADTLYNFTEASISYAKLAPNEAKQKLRELFDRKTTSQALDRCIKSGVIGGNIILTPQDKELLTWMQRLLGNRSSNATIYGALRAAMEGQFDEPVKAEVKKWVKSHIYDDINSFIPFEQVINQSAWEAIKSLGETPPPVDDDDEYCLSLKPEQYADAFLHPEKYRAQYICEAITEKTYRHPDVIIRLGDFLMDMLAFSCDGTSGIDDSWKGFQALVIQGQEALPVFANLLNLENISDDYKTSIIYCMRLIEGEASIREWISKATDQEILKQLANPEPRFLPWLDLLAAHAFFFETEESKKIIEKALKARFTMIHGYNSYCQEEPTSVRLPVVFASFGAGSLPVIKSLVTDLDSDYQRNEVLGNALKVLPYGPIKQVINEGSKLTLKNKIKPYSNDPTYYIIIEHENNQVKIQCTLSNLYFQGIIKDRKLESTAIIECDSSEKALALANRIANECLLVGYKRRRSSG